MALSNYKGKSEFFVGIDYYVNGEADGATPIYNKVCPPRADNGDGTTNAILVGQKISQLERTNRMQETDLLMIARSKNQSDTYHETLALPMIDTGLLSQSDLKLGDLLDVKVPLPAGSNVLAFDGEKWVPYSWPKFTKDRFIVKEGIDPPDFPCDSGEWVEVKKIFACDAQKKFVFCYTTDD